MTIKAYSDVNVRSTSRVRDGFDRSEVVVPFGVGKKAAVTLEIGITFVGIAGPGV